MSDFLAINSSIWRDVSSLFSKAVLISPNTRQSGEIEIFLISLDFPSFGGQVIYFWAVAALHRSIKPKAKYLKYKILYLSNLDYFVIGSKAKFLIN